MLNLTNILAAGGVLAVFTLPGAIWALIGYGATCRRLEERNAAQGQTIAGLLARLQRGSPPPPERGFEPWPRTAIGERMKRLVQKLAQDHKPGVHYVTQMEPLRDEAKAILIDMERPSRGASSNLKHGVYVTPKAIIATTDATLLTAVDPAQQAELDRFHQVRDRFERESG